MFHFEKQLRREVIVLALQGSLDALSAAELKTEAVALGDAKRRKVIVDLGALDLIDSTGVGVLISLFKRVRAVDGVVLFTGLRGQPLEVIKVLRLDRALDLRDRVDEALRELGEA